MHLRRLPPSGLFDGPATASVYGLALCLCPSPDLGRGPCQDGHGGRGDHRGHLEMAIDKLVQSSIT